MKNIAFMPDTSSSPSDKNSVKLWKMLPEDIVGKRKWKKLRKKEKKQCVLQDSFCSNFKGCQTPIPFHVNLSEIKSMGIFGFWMIKFVSSEVMKNVSSGYSHASCKNASAVLYRLCMFIIKRKSFPSLTFYITQLLNGVQSISIRLIYFLFVCFPPPPQIIVLTMVLNTHRRNCVILRLTDSCRNRRYQSSESSLRIDSFQKPNCNPFQS